MLVFLHPSVYMHEYEYSFSLLSTSLWVLVLWPNDVLRIFIGWTLLTPHMILMKYRNGNPIFLQALLLDITVASGSVHLLTNTNFFFIFVGFLGDNRYEPSLNVLF